jgi:serine/threonine protein kinase
VEKKPTPCETSTKALDAVYQGAVSPKSPHVKVRNLQQRLPPSPPASPQLNRLRKPEPFPEPQEHYQISETVLGEGAFAKVKLGTNLKTGQKVAVKSFAITPNMTVEQQEDLKMLRKERDILKKLDHPNVIKLHHFCEDTKNAHMYLQYVDGGDFYGYLCKYGRCTEKELRPLFKQMVSAVAYCHEKGYCHRDVKLENFLFDKTNNRPILIDFGFASPISIDGLYRDFPGSPAYACPEILQVYIYSVMSI